MAGGEGYGDKLDQLACPAGLHVTTSGTLYVCDEANNRVVRYQPQASCGEVVVGVGAGLYHPLGLHVASDESYLLVADSLNYSVVRFPLRSKSSPDSSTSSPGAVTVVGGRGRGNGVGQMGQPTDVRLDEETGTLYVVDGEYDCVRVYTKEEQQLRLEPQLADCSPYDRKIGTCVNFRAGGFGFVVCDGVKYFAHHSDIAPAGVGSNAVLGYPSLVKGEHVEFEPRPDAKWSWRCSGITGPAGAALASYTDA